MTSKAHLKDASRRNLRWFVLKLTKEAGRYGLAESTLLQAATSAQLTPTQNEIREAADYLEKRDMIVIDESAGRWVTTITPHGIDIVEYEPEVRCPKSIGRPEKYWD